MDKKFKRGLLVGIGLTILAKEVIEKEFNTKVVIIKAEDSKEHKAKQAMPGKPAILAE